MGETFARDVTEIAFAIIGLTLVGLLVYRSQGATQVISGTTNAFGNLLKVASFQSGYSAAPGATMQLA